MKNTLVTFFSASGITKARGLEIAKELNADIFEIKPKEKYTKEDLDWTNSSSRSSIEMNDKSSRPEIENTIPNLEEYEIVFLGFPIWWYTCPTIINTFLESYDFTNKTIIPFATSGSSSIDKSVRDLKSKYTTLHFEKGKLLNSISKQQMNTWLNKFK